MRFTCTLAAFLVAAAAVASIVGAASLPAAPLPDVDSGQAEVRGRRASPYYRFVSSSATMHDGDRIRLRSWKDDYLHRGGRSPPVGYWWGYPASRYYEPAQGVTTSNFGSDAGNVWTVKKLASGKISLRSWNGDYLHRPGWKQGVTAWSSGIGNVWTVEELASGKISLTSWRGDSLYRPDSSCTQQCSVQPAKGVTTISAVYVYLYRIFNWSSRKGNEWAVELLERGMPAGMNINHLDAFTIVKGRQFCQITSDNCVTGGGLGASSLPRGPPEGPGPSHSPPNERCVIHVNRPGVLVTPEFNVESYGQCDMAYDNRPDHLVHFSDPRPHWGASVEVGPKPYVAGDSFLLGGCEPRVPCGLPERPPQRAATRYCGTAGPTEVPVSDQDQITWASNFDVTWSRWTICLKAAG